MGLFSGGYMSGQRALFVAINAYPGAALEGCLNDQDTMNDLLLRHGWEQNQIVRLRDRDCTTSRILHELDRLTEPGLTRFCFHYSGHGTIVPGTENDPIPSDAICPIDFDWQPKHWITDKDFLVRFERIPENTPGCWISDSCHSGLLSKDFLVLQRTRHYPHCPVHIHDLLRQLFDKHIVSRGFVPNGPFHSAFVSGCRSDQTSVDAFIDGQHCGAATHYLVQAINELPNSTLVDIVRRANELLRLNSFDQEPQVDGMRQGFPFLS